MKKLQYISTVVVVAALFGGWAPQANGQATWIGGVGGNWNFADNWDTGDVPNSAMESEIIEDGSVLSTSLVDIAALTLGADGELSIGPSHRLNFSGEETLSLSSAGIIDVLNGSELQFQGEVENSGLITVSSLGAFTDLEVDGDSMR